ncbi:hypothetical protein CP97_14662 [Aurantiacibacter atlanticus]|uniref:L,D-TPase catalytic domain-containing protein n=1 Tax=Aurantiacibacter atlanticus TaxID=1648404 RepID=A0A168M0F4_9SPHN|nr:L,D-transpeptidase family protein [Aurantiacibacter atlanticus]ANC50348.1 hypothetical protein CP97_14662 [Aurantiacibacter atlanticus]
MNTGIKWILGVALGVSVIHGATVLLEDPLTRQSDDRLVLTPSDVLVEEETVTNDVQKASSPGLGDAQFYGNDPVASEDRPYVANAVVQGVPAYDPENPFVIKRVLPINGPIRYGEWHWDDEGIPDGSLVVTVDLQARVISVFRDGYEIGAAAALLGTDSHPTPTGVFPILTKERHNVSEKYNNAPMPWTLRLTWDGIAIHGGSTVELGYASHGCIGVPDEFVSRLYDIAQTGDVVIITDGVRTSVGGSLDHSS